MRFASAGLLLVLTVAALGASAKGATLNVAAPVTVAAPLRVQRASGTWQTFPPPNHDGLYVGIVHGPDGNVWITDYYHGLVQLDSAGNRTLFPLTYTKSGVRHRFFPAYPAVGADGKFYLTGCVDSGLNCAFIAIVTTSGQITVVPVPSHQSARFSGLALGPDGNVWFTDWSNVAKITPAGKITEYRYESGETANVLSGMAAGSDGNMWFTEFDAIAVGSVNPATGSVVNYKLAPAIDCGASGMSAAADGNLYFGCGTGFAQVTTQGAGTYYYTQDQPSNSAQEIAAGSDGQLWITALTVLEQFDPSQSALTIYLAPAGEATLYGSAIGPDANQWVLSESGTVYDFIPPATSRRKPGR